MNAPMMMSMGLRHSQVLRIVKDHAMAPRLRDVKPDGRVEPEAVLKIRP